MLFGSKGKKTSSGISKTLCDLTNPLTSVILHPTFQFSRTTPVLLLPQDLLSVMVLAPSPTPSPPNYLLTSFKPPLKVTF